VDSHIISEVINVVMRKEWKQLMLDYPEFGYTTFKDFRDSTEGAVALDAIHKMIEKSYGKSDMLKLFGVNRLDFVDKLFVLLCSERNFALRTNDGDFVDSDIDILSNNDVFFPAPAVSRPSVTPP
jgi:hypothetical protein